MATNKQKKTEGSSRIFCGTLTSERRVSGAMPTPQNENGTPVWETGDRNVAFVNGAMGLINYWEPGKTTVTAKYPSGKTYYWNVVVTPSKGEESPAPTLMPPEEPVQPAPAEPAQPAPANPPQASTEEPTVDPPENRSKETEELRRKTQIDPGSISAIREKTKAASWESVKLEDVSPTVQELGLRAAAEELGVTEEKVRFQFHMEQLALVPEVTEPLAYYGALVGIRNPADLAKVKPETAYHTFQELGKDPDRHFPPPNLDEIKAGVFGAQGFDRPAIVIPDDRKPGNLLVSGEENSFLLGRSIGQILQDGLNLLSNLDTKPPLPRIICGKVELQTFDEYDREQRKDMIGAQVELGGIASPAQDKIENHEDLHCFTGGDGGFSIVMPDRYNMQETVTFTVSENPNSPSIIRRKSYLGGVGARSITFTRRASEVIRATKVVLSIRGKDGNRLEGMPDDDTISLTELYEKINKLDALIRENAGLKRKLEQRAREWLEEKERREKRTALLLRKAEAEEKRRKALQDIIDALRAYIQKAESEYVTLEELLQYAGDDPQDGQEAPEGYDEIRNLRPIAYKLPETAIFQKLDPEKLTNATVEFQKVREQKAEMSGRIGRTPDLSNLRPAAAVVQTEPSEEQAEPAQPDPLVMALKDQGRWTAEQLRDIAELIAFLKRQLITCEARLQDLNSFLTRGLHCCEERLADVGTSPLNFITDDDTYEPLPAYDALLVPTYEGGRSALDELVVQEDRFLLDDSERYPAQIPIGTLRSVARVTKRELALIVAELATLPPIKRLPHEQKAESSPLEQYLAMTVDGYEARTPAAANEPQTYVDNEISIHKLLNELGCEDENDLAGLVNRLSNAELFADMGTFPVLEDAFGETTDKPAALPSVRLMGEGKNATFLPTDTAPSRIFSYGMIQRLVEPEIRFYDAQTGRETDKRGKIFNPLDVYDFKQKFYADPEKTAIARSLGLGYILNMHQAWVPDGFALGSLLYSLVLAPGEEQRIIIKEHKESYSVEDQASAEDTIQDSYANSQQDNEQAAFDNAANRYSAAHSDYQYESYASSKSTSGIGLCFGLIGGTKSSSRNSGSGSSNASQSDHYDEASRAAQTFQTNIKTESERIATAQRASIRVASSSDSESVASKIIANHNHSHVMTVQYWEVMRRYRMETCIEGIDLVLFVPLKPVGFLPQATDPEAVELWSERENWMKLTLPPVKNFVMDRARFNFRYHRLLQHADTLLYKLPYGYRSGLETMKKFAALPKWEYFSGNTMERRTITLTVTGNILECDDLAASLVFSTGRSPLRGRVTKREVIQIHESMNTRKDVLYFLEKARQGIYVIKTNSRMKDDVIYGGFYKARVETHATLDRYAELDLKKNTQMTDVLDKVLPIHLKGKIVFTFTLPQDVSVGDIVSIRIENKAKHFTYRLSQDTRYMEDYEEVSIKRYEEWLYKFSKDNNDNANDINRINHYAENLPECYTNPQVTLSEKELSAIGAIDLTVIAKAPKPVSGLMPELAANPAGSTKDEGDSGTDSKEKEERAKYNSGSSETTIVSESLSLGSAPYYAPTVPMLPVMHAEDVKEMEKTLRHVASKTIRYSQVIWSSLTDDERIILLEPYTVDMNFSLSDTLTKQEQSANTGTEDPIPLLNCVNPHRVLGFYGNCILLPFTYPERLAKVLGKTAAEVQDELYRFHTTSFRVPSTVISVPTEGMVGEAVLGATNVSEKVDITRFWNWKDSDIDHMSIDQSSFNGGSSLLANAQTMRVDAPTQGVAPTAHVDAGGLAAALLARQSPTFADALANTDIRDLLKTADTNASAGREAAVAASSGMVNTAVQAAADVAKAYFGAGGMGGGGLGGSGGGKGGSGFSSLLSGLSSSDLSKLLEKISPEDLTKLLSGAGGQNGTGGNQNNGGGSDPKPGGSGSDPKPGGSGSDPKPGGSSPNPGQTGGGGDTPENPNPPAADSETPSPDPVTSTADEKTPYAPANDREASLHALFEQAREAVGQGYNPISFFSEMVGITDRSTASELIRSISNIQYKENGIDRDELFNHVLQGG